MRKHKLRKMKLTSVDMCRRGANQESFITLHKNAEEDPMAETEQAGLRKAIVDGLKSVLGLGKANPYEDNAQNEYMQETCNMYTEALNKSIESILADETLSDIQKAEMMDESLEQFADAYSEIWAQFNPVSKTAPADTGDAEGAWRGNPSREENGHPEEPAGGFFDGANKEEGDEEMKIDKSRFTPAELAQYEALIAKGLVDDGETGYTADETVAKALNDAMKDVEDLKKRMEINELEEVAKKYEVLGKDSEDLVDTLYKLKKTSYEAYEKYVELMDEQLEMVNKSGLFGEIGKSRVSMGGGDAVSKIESIASEIQKADPSMTRLDAIRKAWEQHPELVAEYEESYK